MSGDEFGDFELKTFALPDGEVSARVWANPGKPFLLFLHANGFCASAYRQVLEPLAADYEIVAPDLRGHGRTVLPADPATHRSWDVYACDVLTLIRHWGRIPVAMAGHSMGATTALLAAAQLETVPRLALVEPVLLPRPVYWVARSPLHALNRNRMPIARQARRRRNGWPDRAAAVARYEKHPGFARWADGVVADYMTDGLQAGPGGGVSLACDPLWEAANYEAQGHNPERAARRAGPWVCMLKAEHGSTVMRPGLLTRHGARLARMDGVGHLAPMETPARVSAWLADTLQDG
ncbi:MAG: alpha/beta hydrolase [Pseudomonadota bacterium]|nr:alpha/beta hydrolase [Pseudomonadota bacterium]